MLKDYFFFSSSAWLSLFSPPISAFSLVPAPSHLIRIHAAHCNGSPCFPSLVICKVPSNLFSLFFPPYFCYWKMNMFILQCPAVWILLHPCQQTPPFPDALQLQADTDMQSHSDHFFLFLARQAHEWMFGNVWRHF